MSKFQTDINKFANKLLQRQQDMFFKTASEIARSVRLGSEITGAPGQPVQGSVILGEGEAYSGHPEDQQGGRLRDSWTPEFPERWVWWYYTNVEYAEAIEEGQQEPYTTKSGKKVTPRPMTLRSAVGGFHSVKMTVAAFDLIVAKVAEEVQSSG